MDDCIFCDVVKGDLGCHKIHDDEHTLAFLDINPITKGHTLVLPKGHYNDFEDLSAHSRDALFRAVQELIPSIRKITKCQGVSIVTHNGSAAGQIIFHAAVHIIPRYTGDGLKLWPGKQAEEDSLTELAKQIKEAY